MLSLATLIALQDLNHTAHNIAAMREARAIKHALASGTSVRSVKESLAFTATERAWFARPIGGV